MIEVTKSSRHSKITGDFAEALVLYWLSKHGFECARVDHTGMDLIARNPHTNELMGISVKSRSRNPGTEKTHVRIDRDNADKLKAACAAFGCTPHFAVVVDAGSLIRCFVMPLARMIELSGRSKNLGLAMTQKHLDRYYADREVIIFQFESKTVRWWGR
jgi:Holliday junction resolvase-like predicted endonuclease